MMHEEPDRFSERRRHQRVQLRMALEAVRLDPDGGDVVDTLHMVDISRGGLAAITDRPYYPGQRVVLCLPISEKGGRRNMYATIRRCRHDKEQGYRVGMEFDSSAAGNWCGVSSAAAAA